jgi:hypothetical protein
MPGVGRFMVYLGGVMGIGIMLALYLLRGRFSLVVDDNLGDTRFENADALQFINLRD